MVPWGKAARCRPTDGFDMRHVIALAACGFSLVGCTSSWLPSTDFLKPAPMTETLRFESEPSNAEARISPTQACRTPCELQVTPTGDMTVTFTLQGYDSQAQSVKLLSPDDPSSGTTDFRLYPNPVFAELEPATAPARPARPPAKKSAPPAKRAATPAPAPRAASPAPRAATPAPPANSPFPAAPAAQFPPPPAPR